MGHRNFGWLAGVAGAALGLALLLGGSVAEARRKARTPDEPLPATLDFVGKWAASAAACSEAESTDKAPVVLSKRHYNQYETHCQLSAVRNAGPIWTANAECTVQGDKQRHSLLMTVTGDAMDLGWDAPKGQKLVRCK